MSIPTLSGSYFRLLTPSNPKMAKGQKHGFRTFILHLAPANLSGFEVCPKRTNGCTLACLNTAGRGGIAAKGMLTYTDVRLGRRTNVIQLARIARTHRFFKEREAFMADLVWDIEKAIRWSRKHKLTPVFRLNGTSDIRWETVPVVRQRRSFRNVCAAFPDIQFYDYTKLTNRKGVPANYDLTFSLADGNALIAADMLAAGHRVAAVFRNVQTVRHYMRETLALRMSNDRIFQAEVVDGDDSDLRFLEPKSVIVGLYAKGQAKRDRTGFVVD